MPRRRRAWCRPAAAAWLFAAPFRSYGLLLIVDCGGGYHAVLAGFERLDVKVGQDVAAGEPVGVMPGWDPVPRATGRRFMSNCGATDSRSIRRHG